MGFYCCSVKGAQLRWASHVAGPLASRGKTHPTQDLVTSLGPIFAVGSTGFKSCSCAISFPQGRGRAVGVSAWLSKFRGAQSYNPGQSCPSVTVLNQGTIELDFAGLREPLDLTSVLDPLQGFDCRKDPASFSLDSCGLACFLLPPASKRSPRGRIQPVCWWTGGDRRACPLGCWC